MILTLSKHNIITSWVAPSAETCTSYTLEVFIWSGNSTPVPVSPTYSITKTNVELLTGNDRINVSGIVNDYIKVDNALTSLTDAVWVQTQTRYTTTTASDYDTPSNVNLQEAVKGYSYALEGENPSPPANIILIPNNYYKVQKGGIFIFPILNSSSTINVVSYPHGTINTTTIVSNAVDSADIIHSEVVYILGNENFVEITLNGDLACTLEVTDECRYTPMDILFLNKNGAKQVLTFFKAKTETIATTSSQYESTANALLAEHQFIKYNINSKSSFKVNSGFVDEGLNEDFRQLLNSSKVWHYNGGTLIPLIVKSSSLEWKTRAKDRLINYEIEFDYAYNDIQ